jgi:phenylalanyl-tRNA synthetase alpha chain
MRRSFVFLPRAHAAITRIQPASRSLVRLSRIQYQPLGIPPLLCRRSSSVVTPGFIKNNVPQGVLSKVGRNLHHQEHHPLRIIKDTVQDYFTRSFRDQITNQPVFTYFDSLHPVVTTKQCFDELNVPPDHVSRSPSDTFYYDANTVLRTHTSAHQTELMRAGHRAFLMSGDCYRRDEIDRSHYPVFHQMEGVRVWEKGTVDSEFVMNDLKNTLEGMVRGIFGPVEMRWVEAYFPFTHPSLELEILFNGNWMETLGCGQIHPKVLERSNLGGCHGWAFGIGLERLAMCLFQIPDIRLFWSRDPRFIKQFSSIAGSTGTGLVPKDFKFQEFSKYPPCLKDLSMWVPEPPPHHNDVAAIIREEAGDVVEEVSMIDEFTHPKTKRRSRCYRITYRSLERTLTDDEINAIQWRVRDAAAAIPGCELR